MRLWSTRESVRQNEPTLLAILETLAAMATSLWIGIHFGTWKHVLIGFCIAPFLLLRTDASCERAIKWFFNILRRLEERSTSDVPWFSMIWASLGGPLVRIGATVVHFCEEPMACIAAIPVNWWRLALATDFAVSPEYLPHPQNPSPSFTWDENDYVISRTYDLWRRISGFFWTKNTWMELIVVPFLMLIYVIPVSLTAITYRFSVKSTALGWFPLFWALKLVKPATGSWKTTLQIDSAKGMPQFVAAWSFICLGLIGIKYGLWAIHYELAARAEAWKPMFLAWKAAGGIREKIATSSLAGAIISFIGPGTIPLWHLAMFFNALLGITIWWKIRTWLAHYQFDHPPTDRTIERTLSIIFFFRHLLVSYIIVCDGYLIWHFTRNLPVPVFSSKPFPWWL